jgi:hypothetical protein
MSLVGLYLDNASHFLFSFTSMVAQGLSGPL